MSTAAISMFFLFAGALAWTIFYLFLNGKSYHKKVLFGVMITSVVFVFIPLPNDVKNNIIYPVLGGFFVGELILGWIRKVKGKFSKGEENMIPQKPSKVSREKRASSTVGNSPVPSKEQVIVSDEDLAQRKRVKKRYSKED